MSSNLTNEDLVYMLKYDPKDNLPSWIKSITWTSNDHKQPPHLVFLPSGKGMLYDEGKWIEP